MIIDMHTHLGNILYPQGGLQIKEKGKNYEKSFNFISMSENSLHRSYGIFKLRFYKMILKYAAKEERKRNLTATLENIISAMRRNCIDYTVCMPVSPYVNFDDLYQAHTVNSCILPFTSVDYTRKYDLDTAFESDVKKGAKGLKLHPIIQKVSLNDTRTLEAVQKFSRHELPVLFHCGFSSYYFGKERSLENPEFGDIRYAVDLISHFPNVTFIVGHAGAYAYPQVIKYFKKNKNIYVDTSFQSPESVRTLIKELGAERVLYGSDWPWGWMEPAVEIVKKACKGDPQQQRLVFHENAARLLNISY